MFIELQRYGDTGHAEKRSFDCGRDRAGIENVDPGVQSAVDAADDHIGRLVKILEDADLHAVGGASFHRPAAPSIAVVDFLANQRHQECD